jgi:hypothetical protein
VGNLGLNTPYQVGDGRTAVLLFGEFRPDADPALIEAERLGGGALPSPHREAARGGRPFDPAAFSEGERFCPCLGG